MQKLQCFQERWQAIQSGGNAKPIQKGLCACVTARKGCRMRYCCSLGLCGPPPHLESDQRNPPLGMGLRGQGFPGAQVRKTFDM